MPACSKQKNPKGLEITFEEASHKYWSIIDGKEIIYTSGTTFVHNFFPKFDPDGSITKRCALKQGISPEELRAIWKEKGLKSSRFGTKIHETMEDVLRGDMLRNKPVDDKEKKTMKVAVKLGKKILECADILGIEKIVFDADIKVAGTMDLFVRAKKDGRIWILDHKTNESIHILNEWNSFALDPISNFPNTNFSQYTLQLNLYENILKRAGYVDKNEKIEKALLHITADGNKSIRVPTCQNDIETMISYRASHPGV